MFFHLPSLLIARTVFAGLEVSSESRSYNGHIQYLYGIPLERVHFFPAANGTLPALLPDWMRGDLNLVAVGLYEKFLRENSALLAAGDPRDAEATIRAFRSWQQRFAFLHNETLLMEFLDPTTPELKSAVLSVAGFQRLLGKIGTDFAQKMGFEGGSKFLYQARMHAEVFGPGDATSPSSYGAEGGVASGVVFTHLPPATLGGSFFEIMDPRGQNPPFGKDEKIPLSLGVGLVFPSWLRTFTPPHRTQNPNPNHMSKNNSTTILDTHRIDWVFQIGLLQYDKRVRTMFVDYEQCPFTNGFREPAAQVYFDLAVEELVALGIGNKVELPTESNLELS